MDSFLECLSLYAEQLVTQADPDTVSKFKEDTGPVQKWLREILADDESGHSAEEEEVAPDTEDAANPSGKRQRTDAVA
jgi:hypothetical protein